MATTHLRICWTSLVIRGKQLKTSLRLHLSAVRRALINRTADKCWWRCEGKGTMIHCLISVGRQYGQCFLSVASLSLSLVTLLTPLPRTSGSVFCPRKWPEFELSVLRSLRNFLQCLGCYSGRVFFLAVPHQTCSAWVHHRNVFFQSSLECLLNILGQTRAYSTKECKE